MRRRGVTALAAVLTMAASALTAVLTASGTNTQSAVNFAAFGSPSCFSV